MGSSSDLAASDPDDIARIAVFSYVHVVLATSFERAPELATAIRRDLVIFFQEMQKANLRRNHGIHSQLCQLGTALADAGLHCVALKGAAELLAPLHAEPAFRFLSDIDILVPERHLGEAVEALRDIGAVPDEVDEINARDHHHVAPLRHTGWLVQVELHRALAQGAPGQILAPENVLDVAYRSGVKGLSVPTPADRLAHAVLHAQFSPPRYRDVELSLRDLLEMEIFFQRLSPDEVESAQEKFVSAEASTAWEALNASRVLILGDPDAFEALPERARDWAKTAIAEFGQPGRRRNASLRRWTGWYAKEILFNRERRAHYARKFTRPGALKRALAHHRDRWRRIR